MHQKYWVFTIFSMTTQQNVGAERAHVYSILAATVGDDVSIERSQNPVKSLTKSHVTEKAKASYKISKSCQEKKLLVLVFFFFLL